MTLIHLLQQRARLEPSRILYTFLHGDDSSRKSLTFGELDRQASAIAKRLRARVSPGQRAVLMYSPGLEFISAFFGCLYAGVVAVPAFPPRNRRTAPRIHAIIRDSKPQVILADKSAFTRSREFVEALPESVKLTWIETAGVSENEPGQWLVPNLEPDSLAYLQYTSGSTSAPRGVMVTHGNLMHNLSFLCDGREHTGIVSWLPMFHDMGLIYAVLQALYANVPCVLMPPAAFLQKPVQWLEALSNFQFSTAIAPNFAYELCIQKVSQPEKARLDLSRWTMALNAAEPVRGTTLERFAAAFACCGFRPEFLKPAYGLAEATLGVSIFGGRGGCSIRNLDKSAFEQNRIVERAAGAKKIVSVVGCGSGAPDQEIAIVNPQTLRRCGPKEVGEIWLSSPSVAAGYWKRSDDTAETFRARLSDSGDGPFLRTGDLAFLDESELFVTGRLKDMIIIRGGNHYPQDIERTVQETHPAIQRDAGAAFSIEVNDEERLIIVQELTRHAKADLAGVLCDVRQAVTEGHGIQAHAIVLVKPHTVPKTSSGKIQRRMARQLFLDGRLDVLAEWRAEISGDANAASKGSSKLNQKSAASERDDLRDWFVARLAETLRIPREEIDHREPFSRYGLDSLGAVSLAGELEKKLGRHVAASLLFDHPSVEALVRHLSSQDTEQRNRIECGKENSNGPIALIGFGCRFPRAGSPDEFWELLRNGVDAISEVPTDRWDADAFYDPAPGASGKMNTKWGGFLEGVDRFAAEFFEISPREASQMDPQQRLLLEVAWEALENSAIPAARLAGSRTGVFIGMSGFDYSLRQLRDSSLIDAYAGTGVAHSIAANRISYFFDFRGPSMVVDTACSSSLVAIHQACESLRRGETDLALSGGVNLILGPEMSIALSNARMMASDGRCKTFDSRADGYVRGEGCGVVVLKRLEDAERDGNAILALLHGSAVNQDGRSNGLTAPNGPAQEAVIRAALGRAGIGPGEISYVECHGTGTALGDPQEVEALQRVLSEGVGRRQKCGIGSVKTNIGHLEAAAGVAGLLKVVLAMMRRRIPPHLHFKKLNPHIRLDRETFEISSELVDWNPRGRRFAGVSSFGFGGANCHVVVGEGPSREPPEPASGLPPQVLSISAKTHEDLRNLAGAMGSHLESGTGDSFADICYTANTGRSQFRHRLALVAASSSEASKLLGGFVQGEKSPHVYLGDVRDGDRKKVAFLFPGQGSQYVGMGRELYETQPVFRKVIQDCDAILRPQLDRSLISVLYPEGGQSTDIDATLYAQPALFAVEYALATLWKSLGIVPDALLGHSLGEYVAACVAGVFDLESGLKLVAARARLMDSLPRNGGMAIVFADQECVSGVIARTAKEVSIAAINGPNLTVISGVREALNQVVRHLSKQGVGSKRLKVSHAFHSNWMDPILEEFSAAAEGFTFRPPEISLVSNVTGDWFSPSFIPDSQYWFRQIREPVQFARGVRRLFEGGCRQFFECGPAQILSSMARRCLNTDSDKGHEIAWYSVLDRGRETSVPLLDCIARFFAGGGLVDWQAFHRHETRRIVSLPTYRFDRLDFSADPHATRTGSSAMNPEWSRLVRIGNETSEKTSVNLSFETEIEKLTLLNRFSDCYLFRSLEELGVPREAGPQSSEDLRGSKIQARYRKAVSGWLQNRNRIETSASLEPNDLWPRLEQLFESELYLPLLVKNCGESLAHTLRGEADPLSRIFPNGSSETMERIYADSTVARYCNGIVKGLLEGIVHSIEADAVIRILEIGGGTGATTRYLLPILPPERTIYTFTDLGPSFIQQASRRFKEFPFVECRTLDIEEQNLLEKAGGERFDVVVASNVLHATKLLRNTLLNLEPLIAPSGWMIIWEAVKQQPWMDVCFSLLDGWQRFEDASLRGSQPLLDNRMWIRELCSRIGTSAGFPEIRSKFQAFGQSVFLTQKAGKSRTRISVHKNTSSARDQIDERISDLLYRIDWRKSQGLFDQDENGASLKSGSWLILGDPGGFGGRLADLLVRSNQRAIIAESGSSYCRVAEGRWKLDPFEPGHFTELLREGGLFECDTPFSGIVCLWGLEVGKRLSLHSIKRAQSSAFEIFPNLIRSIVTEKTPGSIGKPRIWIVTRGAHRIPASDEFSSSCASALLWGMGRCFRIEYPEYFGGLIDLGSGSAKSDAQKLCELLTCGKFDRQTCIRGNQHYEYALTRLDPGAVSTGSKQISSEGTYLITGGLGEIGIAVARWLVEHGARRLVLMGRKRLPVRSTWRKHIAANGPFSSRILEVMRLESMGASVHCVSVDIADAKAAAKFFKRFNDEALPPIRGVFHAAGTVGEFGITDCTDDAVSNIIRPKAIGALNLSKCLPMESLDFIVFFSSASVLLGSRGYSAYAAANSFLDAFADSLRQSGMRALSVNWGPWNDLGMAKRDGRRVSLERHGIFALDVRDAMEALFKLQEGALASAAVMSVDWRKYFENAIQASGSEFLKDLAPPKASQSGGSALACGVGPAEPGERFIGSETTGEKAIDAVVGGILSEVLQLDVSRIDSKQPFSTLGLDSILAVQVKHEIELRFGVPLPIEEIAAFNLSGLQERVRAESLTAGSDSSAVSDSEASKVRTVRD